MPAARRAIQSGSSSQTFEVTGWQASGVGSVIGSLMTGVRRRWSSTWRESMIQVRGWHSEASESILGFRISRILVKDSSESLTSSIPGPGGLWAICEEKINSQAPANYAPRIKKQVCPLGFRILSWIQMSQGSNYSKTWKTSSGQ